MKENSIYFKPFKRLLILCLGVSNFTILKLLFFDTSSMTKKERNTVIVLVAHYVCTIWNSRSSTGDKIFLMKSKILQQKNIYHIILKHKMTSMFTDNYCKMNRQVVDDI